MANDRMSGMGDSQMNVREKERRTSGKAEFISADVEGQALKVGVCPVCGAENETDSLFCERCGARLRELLCPKCGAPMDEGADYCERCHTYVDVDHCPFCNGDLSENDTFCPECGAPLAGIECPVCHTVGHFGFCASCGTPLTDRARQDMHEVWDNLPYADKIRQLEDELEHLWLVRPVTSERQRQEMQSVKDLCDRVKKLMALEGQKTYERQPDAAEAKPAAQSERVVMTEDELKQQILNKQEALQALLDMMEMPAAVNPAAARNYAMARKPHVSRLAWKCNYKHALHASPMGCACPQYGGKWVVTDGKTEITAD